LFYFFVVCYKSGVDRQIIGARNMIIFFLSFDYFRGSSDRRLNQDNEIKLALKASE
jgi:hypothetical protein